MVVYFCVVATLWAQLGWLENDDAPGRVPYIAQTMRTEIWNELVASGAGVYEPAALDPDDDYLAKIGVFRIKHTYGSVGRWMSPSAIEAFERFVEDGVSCHGVILKGTLDERVWCKYE